MDLWMEVYPPHLVVRKITISQKSNIWEKSRPYNCLPNFYFGYLLELLHGGPHASSQAQHHKLNLNHGPGATALSWDENSWSRSSVTRHPGNSARPSLFPRVIFIPLGVFLSVLSLKYLSCQEHLKWMSGIEGTQMWHIFQMDQLLIDLLCFSSLENPCEWLHHSHPEENWVPVLVWSERRNVLKGKGPTETASRKSTHTPPWATSSETGPPVVSNIREHKMKNPFCTPCMHLPLSSQWSLAIPVMVTHYPM